MGRAIVFASSYIFTSLLVLMVNAAFDDYISRNITFPISLAARADFSKICLNNLLPGYNYDESFIAPCRFPGPTNISTAETTCKALTVINDDLKIVAVAFRGTTTQIQANYEKNFTTVTYFNTQVHQYFHFALTQLFTETKLIARFTQLYSEYIDAKGYKLYITGHSLGAALASLFAVNIRSTTSISPDDIVYITYGEPRVGWQDYADLFTRLIQDSYHVTHAWDPVPHLPPVKIFGSPTNYTHAPSEIWFNNTMGAGATHTPPCNVDDDSSFTNPSCSNIKEDFIEGILLGDNQTAQDILYYFHDSYYDYNTMTTFVEGDCKSNTTPTSPTTKNPNPVCPSGYTPSKVNSSICYNLVATSVEWFISYETCQSNGGNLVSIHSAFENLDLLNRKICTNYWIGLFNNGTFEWVDGTNLGYKNWNPNGYPTNVTNDACVMMNEDGTWENHDCTLTNCYICMQLAS